ncbi:ATP-binding cassette domain-containing protein [Actinoplanes bogorensis]|uniref:ATP-binding cassette domain-containing protein n=1 Tax=Paractinoplanes bogorensis TaxID=1610840 RepID=A0ABS5YM28_9ACTN|nr:ATP-binding cassette domain-containing protein [Actinoplanes bogorensis]MBU2664101.1 ATP-binding cassette domain-containing protein [Actinoplanes bogorensis]
MRSPLLEVSDLSISYRGRRRRAAATAVDRVSLDIGVGETVGLVGESGSGKSSLGNAVLGLVPAASGRIVFAGRDITHLRGGARRPLATEIQAVFQDPYSSLNPYRTVGQSVLETLTATTMPAVERDLRLGEMLTRVGLDRSAAERYPSQFSGGQRQRIAIARALMPSPKLVVCDESVSALDLSVQAQVLNLFVELQRDLGVSYLFITHDLSVVRHVSSRVAVLRHGQLMEFDRTEQVIGNPSTAYTRKLLAAAPVPDVEVQRLRRAANRAWRALTAGADGDRAGWQQDIERLAVRTGNAVLADRLASAPPAEAHRLLFDAAAPEATGDIELIVTGDTAAVQTLAAALKAGDPAAARAAHDFLWTEGASR